MKKERETAFITGASRGIGEAIAMAFAASGRNLALAARTEAEVQRVARKAEALGVEALPLVADVSQPEQVQSAVTTAIERFTSIDVLVNSAGICGPIGPLVDNGLAEWRKTIQINLLGTVYCIHAVLSHMIRRRKGSIINLSGGGAVEPRPCFSAYAASKAAVIRLTETVAQEVREFGVCVNAIAPGPVNTRMLDEILNAAEKSGREWDRARQQKVKGGTPPEKAAELALFLASPAARGVTGRLISAVWDEWKSIPARLEAEKSSSLFTLRRIDGQRFTEIA